MSVRPNRRLTRAVAVTAAGGCALTLALVGTAQAATDPASPPTYDRTVVDTSLKGAAFVVSGDVSGDVRPELVATGYFPFGPSGAPTQPGEVRLYTNTAKNKQGGDIDYVAQTVVSQAEGIWVPNKPALADVDGDLDVDIILPGGYFFERPLGSARGSLTWWENRADGGTWVRHNIITGSVASYHGAAFADFDGDGIKDIVTTAEDGGSSQNFGDDVVETQFLKGLGGGSFAAPVTIANHGGSLPLAYDVNGDGLLDIVTAQYFAGATNQPNPNTNPTPQNASFVWFEHLADTDGALTSADFAARIIGANQGPGFSIQPVPNFRGDGVTRWVATNHTNGNLNCTGTPPLTPPAAIPPPLQPIYCFAFPQARYPLPAVFEFTPGGDVTQPWAVTQLSAPGAFNVTGFFGQAAPGSAGIGDLDGDGDKDIAVSGDGDRSLYWLEQKADGTFPKHQFPDAAGWGQAGGPVVADLNRDGITEVTFTSYDQSILPTTANPSPPNSLAFWQR